MKDEKKTKEVIPFKFFSLNNQKHKVTSDRIHNKIVQKFPKTSVKWHLSLFFKMFSVSAYATS